MRSGKAERLRAWMARFQKARFQMTRSQMAGWPAIAGIAGAALSCAVVAGCYERVVDAEGFNAEHYDIHEPNVGEGSGQGVLDEFADLIFGTEDGEDLTR